MKSEQKAKRSKRVSHEDISQKNIPGKGNFRYKDSETEHACSALGREKQDGSKSVERESAVVD